MPDIESRWIYLPQYFDLREFVPPEVYQALGVKAWAVLDPRIVWTMDQIRMWTRKPITINNWHIGGAFKYRGFRPRDYTETAAKYSQHFMGRAADFDVSGMTADEFRKTMKMSQGIPAFKYVTACEEGVNWVHIDIRPVPKGTNSIIYFKG